MSVQEVVGVCVISVSYLQVEAKCPAERKEHNKWNSSHHSVQVYTSWLFYYCAYKYSYLLT